MYERQHHIRWSQQAYRFVTVAEERPSIAPWVPITLLMLMIEVEKPAKLVSNNLQSLRHLQALWIKTGNLWPFPAG